MAIFDTITLTWEGKEHTVLPHQILRTIARVEEVITVQELIQYAERGTAPLAKLAQAYASVLRMHGARVTDEEVYAGMFRGDADATNIPVAINTLLNMMVPKQAFTGAPAEGNGPPAVASLSKPVTKPRSGASGLPQKRSGH